MMKKGTKSQRLRTHDGAKVAAASASGVAKKDGRSLLHQAVPEAHSREGSHGQRKDEGDKRARAEEVDSSSARSYGSSEIRGEGGTSSSRGRSSGREHTSKWVLKADITASAPRRSPRCPG